MDKLPVGQLPDLASSNNDDEIMVITNDEYNQLKKEKISDLITDFTSTDENNAIVKGTDGKMFVTDFGNAANITEGTLPVSVLPDIPKNKLPEIEIDDLPDSGITAGTYTYPTDIVINSKGQVTSITEGQPGANNANQDLSNLGPLGLDKINQSKALETGSVSSDADVYADVEKYAHSTFDLSKFSVVGNPTISDDGILTNTSNLNCVLVNNIDLRTANIWEIDLLINIQDTDLSNNICLVFNIDNRLVFQISTDLKISLFINVGTQNISFSSNVSVIQQGLNKIKLKYDSSSGYNIFVNDIQVASNTTTSKTTANGSFDIGGGYSTLFMNEPNSIDLKSFAIWADGIPVFNGNKTGTDTINEIQIPYTLSKTGSKIVDVAYRDRVQDLYQQTGEALYYTIDEQNQNFTLPMGEVYGMITNLQDNSANTSLTNLTNGLANVICTTAPTTTSTASSQNPAVVIENYVNGTSGYRVYSDGYCEQWGYLSSITASGTIIQLLKPYINANYNISFGRSNLRSDLNENIQWKNKTTSQITIFVQAGTLNADWRTCGYIK